MIVNVNLMLEIFQTKSDITMNADVSAKIK